MTEGKLDFLEKKISTMGNALTKTDIKIVNFLRKSPEKFSILTTTELAKSIGISVAAITRFVQKMGFEKLQDLKLTISRNLETSIHTQYKDINKQDDILNITKKVLQTNIESMQNVQKILKEDDLKKAIEILTNARRVIFVGIGGSASVAQDAYHKFMRLGKIVELITDVHRQIILSSIGNEKDAIVVVSNEGSNTDLNSALKIAKENQMKIIALTQFSKSELTRIADVCLFTLAQQYNCKPEALISRIAEYSLVDMLYVCYYMRLPDQMEDNLLKIRNNMMILKNYDN